jgi:hypothetical protein
MSKRLPKKLNLVERPYSDLTEAIDEWARKRGLIKGHTRIVFIDAYPCGCHIRHSFAATLDE